MIMSTELNSRDIVMGSYFMDDYVCRYVKKEIHYVVMLYDISTKFVKMSPYWIYHLHWIKKKSKMRKSEIIFRLYLKADFFAL